MIRQTIIIAALLATVAAWADMEWQTAISQKEQVTKGLVAYWAMRNSGTTVYDEWTGGYNGTAAGGVTFGESYAAVGYGASFDGTNDYIALGDNDAFSFTDGTNEKPFSISAWVNINAGKASTACIWSKDMFDGAWKREYLFVVRTTGHAGVLIFDNSDPTGGTLLDGRSSDSLVTFGSWHYIAATYDGSKNETGIRIYVNGVDRTATQTKTGTYTGMRNTAAPMEIGRRLFSTNPANTVWMHGLVDEVRIYNRALTADEVKQLYRMGAIPKGIK
jgi:hypothetical protein